MASFVIADDGIVFDGRTPEQKPLGGVESSVVALAETLVARGHDVTVCNHCEAPLDYHGVKWRPLKDGLPATCDLYIANRGDKLILAMPGARRTVFWIHNPARFLRKWRYRWKLFWKKPAIIFIGTYHATTYPAWRAGGERIVIPYGLQEMFTTAKPGQGVPGPKAVFTSNPLRDLDWLMDLWVSQIRPHVPGAELHVFSGAATYVAVGQGKADPMHKVLNKAASLKDHGVILRGPVPKAQLIEEFRTSRVQLYKGTLDETFCSAVAEAQAMGVPGVVQAIGSLVERVVDGKPGVIAPDDNAFAKAAVRIVTDDKQWKVLHNTALTLQRSWTWDKAAARFEELLP